MSGEGHSAGTAQIRTPHQKEGSVLFWALVLAASIQGGVARRPIRQSQYLFWNRLTADDKPRKVAIKHVGYAPIEAFGPFVHNKYESGLMEERRGNKCIVYTSNKNYDNLPELVDSLHGAVDTGLEVLDIRRNNLPIGYKVQKALAAGPNIVGAYFSLATFYISEVAQTGGEQTPIHPDFRRGQIANVFLSLGPQKG